jgi:hypothetical protein
VKKYIMFYTILSVILLTAHVAYAGRLMDNGDGTISDKVSNLMWQRQDDDTERYWEEAKRYCSGLTLAGHTDWRMPTLRELLTIVDKNKTNPAINTKYFPVGVSHAYPNTVDSRCWTSTPKARQTYEMYYVNFYDGHHMESWRSASRRVRCVRAQ